MLSNQILASTPATETANPWIGLLWLVVLLLGNGFFVGAEFAVISARRAQIEPRAEAGSRPASITIKAMEKVSLMLATIQLGVTICSLLILVIVEPSVHQLLEGPLHALGLGEASTTGVAFGITLAIVSFMHVVIGEMVPKNISFSIPERAALVLVPPLYLIAPGRLGLMLAGLSLWRAITRPPPISRQIEQDDAEYEFASRPGPWHIPQKTD